MHGSAKSGDLGVSTEADTPRYFAFISYSHQDRRWADWLHKSLENYRPPRKLLGTEAAYGLVPVRLRPVFRDREELASASDLGAAVKEALRQSASLIVICSPQAAKSKWVNEETLAFKRLGREDRIFCLIVDGEPNATDMPGRRDDECFPPALRFRLSADGSLSDTRIEPIAADARQDKDGKSNAKLKLIAGVLGVGFDALKRREDRRRTQRMAVVTSLALGATLVTTGLAIDAVIARKTAEKRQQEAETLVGFMLGDLNDKLRQVQRLDILEAVDNQAMAYFLTRPAGEMTDHTLILRVKALQKIGNVREDQGHLAAGIESYRAASALAAELMRRAPGDPERESAYAETLVHEGHAYWFQGDLDHALDNFTRAATLLDRATSARPSDSGLTVLSVARTNAGRVFEARGDFAAARTQYEKVLATTEGLAARESNGVRHRSDLADAYDSLGKLALEQGQLKEAIATYRSVRRIKVQLAAEHPNDRNLQDSLLTSDGILGRTLALCGANVAAEHYVREAVDKAAALMVLDATNPGWRYDFALYSRDLGRVERFAGRLHEAVIHYADAVRLYKEFVATDHTDVESRRELAETQIELASIRLVQRNDADAGLLIDAAIKEIATQRAVSPGNRNLRLLDARAHIVRGQLALPRHDVEAARDQWMQAGDAIATAARTGADPNFLAAWATALLLLDDAAAARPIVEQLLSMGYRAPDFGALLAAKRPHYSLKSPEPWCASDESSAAETR
jgi:tetratricopeptide (TPR) repeat protein